MNSFSDVKHATLNYLRELETERLCYLIACILLVAPIITTHSTYKHELADYALIPTASFLTFGFINYLSTLYGRINSKNIGKGLIALVVLLVTKFNLAIADQSVNILLEAPSSYFTYTRTFISILTVPFSLSLIILFSFPMLLIITMIDLIIDVNGVTIKNIISLNIRAIGREVKPSLLFGRMFAVVTITSFAVFFLQNTNNYINLFENAIKSFAFNFELQGFSYCKLPQSSKSIMISDQLVYFGVKKSKNYEFKTVKCVEKL